MGKIVSIGGGSIGFRRTPQTTKIDQEIINLSGKKKPKVLFIPTATHDSAEYVEAFHNHYEKRLGCDVKSLLLYDAKYKHIEIEKMILNADIIYVGGGNTLNMMKTWRKFGVDKLLHKAYEKNIVLCGLSAGSICWYNQGNSDSWRDHNKKAPLILVKGLNLVNAVGCPHYDNEKDRKPFLKKMMQHHTGVAIAFDSCAAFEIVGDWYRVITSKKGVGCYKVYWKEGKYYCEKIRQRKEFMPLKELLVKG
ncbi:Type 1 glutamine amidotransferase-like domain-containing protein [Candidatus Woesearchaeota archaeon]|nr:Type 1 glutamine amidotransferase-like domain-containing protein [Candidatus Woesearchaeota archaeon]